MRVARASLRDCKQGTSKVSRSWPMSKTGLTSRGCLDTQVGPRWTRGARASLQDKLQRLCRRVRPGDGGPVHHSWAKGQRVFRLQVRGPKQLWPVRVSVRRRVGGPALIAGRLGVTIGARADGYSSGPALMAGRSCNTPGAYCGERSRSQALCQRQLDCGRRRQEETRWSASGPTRSLAWMKLLCSKNNSPESWCTQGPRLRAPGANWASGANRRRRK